MISNKDVGFNKQTGELMINGETHELASPEALDALAVDVGTNTTAIEGLDARVTALEEGGAGGVAWTVLDERVVDGNNYNYFRNLKFNDINIFDPDSEIKEFLIYIKLPSLGYAPPPIIAPYDLLFDGKTEIRNIDAYDTTTKHGFMVVRDGGRDDSITVLTYNLGANVIMKILAR